MKRKLLHAAAVLLGAILFQPPAGAQSVETFYRGKTIRMLVGYGPGTGYDIFVRVLARHMGAHIPGRPLIVTENMPGAASLTMANYLYNVAPRDGTVLGMPLHSLLTEPLFGNSLAKYDASKFTWLGSLGSDTELCFTWHTSGINTLDDAKTHKVLVGSTGAASPTSLFPRLLNRLFGTQFDPLVGYPDSGAIGIAMERGELQGFCGFGLAGVKSARPDWLAKNEIVILAQLALKPSPELKGVPLVMDFAKDEATRQALTLNFADEEINRPLAGPPGMPADRVQALRAAFEETFEDPDFLSDAKQASIDTDSWVDGEGIGKLIGEIYATPPDVVEMVREIRNGK